MEVDFGSFTGDVPDGWTVGEDDDLLAVFPPTGDAYVQISSYRGPDDVVPTQDELWDFAQDSLERSWAVHKEAIRRDGAGYALDAEGPTSLGHGVIAFRLWPSRLLFATFYYTDQDGVHVPAAKAFMASLQPAN